MPFTYKYQKDPRTDLSDVVIKTTVDASNNYLNTTAFIVSDSNSTNSDYLAWKEWDAQSGNTTEAAS